MHSKMAIVLIINCFILTNVAKKNSKAFKLNEESSIVNMDIKNMP